MLISIVEFVHWSVSFSIDFISLVISSLIFYWCVSAYLSLSSFFLLQSMKSPIFSIIFRIIWIIDRFTLLTSCDCTWSHQRFYCFSMSKVIFKQAPSLANWWHILWDKMNEKKCVESKKFAIFSHSKKKSHFNE